jgi:phage-related protein
MSEQTYAFPVHADRPLVWLHREVRTPPFSAAARVEAGVLLRRLQRGEILAMPHARPMPSLGRGCHEFRVQDGTVTWRILVRLDADAVVIGAISAKKATRTPRQVLEACRRRFRHYDAIVRGDDE